MRLPVCAMGNREMTVGKGRWLPSCGCVFQSRRETKMDQTPAKQGDYVVRNAGTGSVHV